MSEPSAVTKVTECVKIRSDLTEAEFREVERLLGFAPTRYKEWAGLYVFERVTPAQADAVCAYLRSLPVTHERETNTLWAPRPGSKGEQPR